MAAENKSTKQVVFYQIKICVTYPLLVSLDSEGSQGQTNQRGGITESVERERGGATEDTPTSVMSVISGVSLSPSDHLTSNTLIPSYGVQPTNPQALEQVCVWSVSIVGKAVANDAEIRGSIPSTDVRKELDSEIFSPMSDASV